MNTLSARAPSTIPTLRESVRSGVEFEGGRVLAKAGPNWVASAPLHPASAPLLLAQGPATVCAASARRWRRAGRAAAADSRRLGAALCRRRGGRRAQQVRLLCKLRSATPGRPGAAPLPSSRLPCAPRRLVCVVEDHSGQGEAKTTVGAVDLASGAVTTLVSGADFYASPRPSPDGTK